MSVDRFHLSVEVRGKPGTGDLVLKFTFFDLITLIDESTIDMNVTNNHSAAPECF